MLRDVILGGKNNTFSLLWEIRSIFMQNCFIVLNSPRAYVGHLPAKVTLVDFVDRKMNLPSRNAPLGGGGEQQFYPHPSPPGLLWGTFRGGYLHCCCAPTRDWVLGDVDWCKLFDNKSIFFQSCWWVGNGLTCDQDPLRREAGEGEGGLIAG